MNLAFLVAGDHQPVVGAEFQDQHGFVVEASNWRTRWRNEVTLRLVVIVRGGLPICFRPNEEPRMRMVAVRTRVDHRHGQPLGVFFIMERAERGLRRGGAKRRRRGRMLLRTAADQKRAHEERETCKARHSTNVPSGALQTLRRRKGEGLPSRDKLVLQS